MHPLLPLLFVGNALNLLQARSSDLLPSANIDVEIVNDESSFRSLRESWNAIVSAHPEPSIFLRHEWFEAAWQWRKRDATLCMMTFFREDQLIGIAPTIITRSSKRIGPRRLTFLTVPDTQHCDIIAAPGVLHEVVTAFALKLYALRRTWDSIDLAYFSATSAACSLLLDILPAHGIVCRRAQMPDNPYICLQSGWPAYYGSRSRRLKKHVNQTINRVSRLGQISIQCVRGHVTEDDLKRAVGDAVKVCSKSWKGGNQYALEQPGPNAFIRHLSAHAGREGWLSLWIMYLNAEAVASEYHLAFGDCVHALRADFDERYSEQSIGSYLNYYVVRELFAQGVNFYYMGPGENRYKTRWSTDAAPLAQLNGYASTTRGGYAYLRRLGSRAFAAARRISAPRT